jgi:hypothetical protein
VCVRVCVCVCVCVCCVVLCCVVLCCVDVLIASIPTLVLRCTRCYPGESPSPPPPTAHASGADEDVQQQAIDAEAKRGNAAAEIARAKAEADAAERARSDRVKQAAAAAAASTASASGESEAFLSGESHDSPQRACAHCLALVTRARAHRITPRTHTRCVLHTRPWIRRHHTIYLLALVHTRARVRTHTHTHIHTRTHAHTHTQTHTNRHTRMPRSHAACELTDDAGTLVEPEMTPFYHGSISDADARGLLSVMRHGVCARASCPLPLLKRVTVPCRMTCG